MSNPACHISDSASLNDTAIGDKCIIYERVRARKSEFGNLVSIGDDGVLINSYLESNITINRRNFIQDSRIGRFTYTGENTTIRGARIGRFCSISWNVSIGGKDHDVDMVTNSSLWAFRNMDGIKQDSGNFIYGTNHGDCTIGSDVWIATSAVVLRDVVVGHGSIIGAGAVVTRNVDPYTIVAGVPARTIRNRFDEKIARALLELQWWDWPVDLIRKNVDLIYNTKVDLDVIRRLSEIQED